MLTQSQTCFKFFNTICECQVVLEGVGDGTLSLDVVRPLPGERGRRLVGEAAEPQPVVSSHFLDLFSNSARCIDQIVLERNVCWSYFRQGTLTEREGAVPLTSSLR